MNGREQPERQRGLIENARRIFDVPIAHLVSIYGLAEAGSPA